MNSIRIALIAPLLSAAAFSAAQNPLRDFFVAGDQAIGMLQPRAVGGPGVSSFAWSGDGRYLLIVCAGTQGDSPAPNPNLTLAGIRKLSSGEQTWISLFDMETGKVQVLWSAPRRTWQLAEPRWLTNSNRAYIVASQDARDSEGFPTHGARVLEIDSDEERVHEFFTIPESKTTPSIAISPSPTRSIAVMSVLNRDPSEQAKPLNLFLIGDMSRNSRPLGLTGDVSDLRIAWATDGWHPIAYHETPMSSDGTPQPKLVLDFNRDSVAESFKVKYYEPPKVQGIRTDVDVNGVLWLSSGDSKTAVMAAPEVESVAVSKRGVAYISQGIALVRPLINLPVRDYFGFREEVEHPLAERRAKRCFLCLLKYAKAHGDRLPEANIDLPEALRGYSEDPQDLDGFSYLHKGGTRASISNPQGTVLGSVNTLTGKVFLYADGNVRWESNGLGTASAAQ